MAKTGAGYNRLYRIPACYSAQVAQQNQQVCIPASTVTHVAAHASLQPTMHALRASRCTRRRCCAHGDVAALFERVNLEQLRHLAQLRASTAAYSFAEGLASTHRVDLAQPPHTDSGASSAAYSFAKGLASTHRVDLAQPPRTSAQPGMLSIAQWVRQLQELDVHILLDTVKHCTRGRRVVPRMQG